MIIENKLKWNLKVFLIIIMLFALIYQAHALGIAPSRNIIDYDTAEHTYNVRIINNEHKDMTLMVYAEGELQDYVTTPTSKIEMKSSEEEKEFSYKLKLPENLEPGTRNLDIIVLELSENTDSNAMILSKMSMKHQLMVNVPYPGIYAEGVVYITEANSDSVTITTNIVNKGLQPINTASGDIIIKGPTNKELARIKTDSAGNIAPQSYGQLVNSWTAPEPGEYYAEVVINYDGKQFIAKKTFTIGNQEIDIKSLQVKNFKLGTVAKFDIDLVNNWNQPINDVYGEIEILDKQGNTLDKVKTVNIELPAYTTTTVSTFWDATNVKVGEYDIKAVVHYIDKTKERVFNAVIGIDSLKIIDNTPSGNVVAAKQEGGKLSLLYILVIVSLVVNVAWFVYYKFLRKKSE